ncbi:right-handed parallel beta-helix repeat-containing protein [Candidatus Poribacteria bacterium]|nr:right-handed parallel beta-helix repeat-containing protein [Candidatus Poribacteria bacterium]
MKKLLLFDILIIIFFITPVSGAVSELDDYAITHDTTLEGEIYIKGLMNIQPGVTVTIKPGTIIKFVKKDTDGDDLGESGIYIQGTFIARGESTSPIIFTSAETNASPGDWDNIFFVVSEGEKNLLENCKIEYSYRGIHAHFSKLEVNNVQLLNNYRAMQLQESVVKVENCSFVNNNSAVRFRDSEVMISKSKFLNNYSAINFFRSEVEIKDNFIEQSILQSIHSRESKGLIEDNKIIYNRNGINMKESNVNIKRNIIRENKENAISINYCSTGMIEIEKNIIEWNGGHGVAITNSNVNLNNNNILQQGKYNLYLQNKTNTIAISNWWGGKDGAYIKSKIYDYAYDSALEQIQFKPFLEIPMEQSSAKNSYTQRGNK